MEWWRYFSCCCRTLVWITLDWIIVAIHEDMTGKEKKKKRTRRNFVWLCLLSFVAGPLSLSRVYRRRSKFSIHGAPSALSSFLEMIPPLLWNAIPKTILVVFNEAKSLSLLLRVRTPGKRRISLVSIGRGCVSLVVSHVGEQWWTVLFPFFFFFLLPIMFFSRLSTSSLPCEVCQCQSVLTRQRLLFLSLFFFSLFERITQRVTRCSRLSTVALPATSTAGQFWWSPRIHPPSPWVIYSTLLSFLFFMRFLVELFNTPISLSLLHVHTVFWPHSWRTILTRDLQPVVFNIIRPKFSNFLRTLLFILLFHLKANGEFRWSAYRVGCNRLFILLGHWLSWSGSWTTKAIRRWPSLYWRAIIKAVWICFRRRIRSARPTRSKLAWPVTAAASGTPGVRPAPVCAHRSSRHRPARCSVFAAVTAWLRRPTLRWCIRKILGAAATRTTTAADASSPGRCRCRRPAKRLADCRCPTVRCRRRIRWPHRAAEVDPTRSTATTVTDLLLSISPAAAWEVCFYQFKLSARKKTHSTILFFLSSVLADVPSWLKGLRLHKYAHLFSLLTYDEMLALTEEQLELQGVTKGARHKIALSILRLRERPTLLAQLEKVPTLFKQ